MSGSDISVSGNLAAPAPTTCSAECPVPAGDWVKPLTATIDSADETHDTAIAEHLHPPSFEHQPWSPPVQVQFNHMGHLFRPSPWPSFTSLSDTSFPAKQCSGVRSQSHGGPCFNPSLFWLMLRDVSQEDPIHFFQDPKMQLECPVGFSLGLVVSFSCRQSHEVPYVSSAILPLLLRYDDPLQICCCKLILVDEPFSCFHGTKRQSRNLGGQRTFAIQTVYLISGMSRPCPWPLLDCFHEGTQLRYTWPKIPSVMHHFAGFLHSLTETLRSRQWVHLKLLCSSFSSSCQEVQLWLELPKVAFHSSTPSSTNPNRMRESWWCFQSSGIFELKKEQVSVISSMQSSHEFHECNQETTQLKLRWASCLCDCQAVDVVYEQYFVNYILILLKLPHMILHSLYFVSKPLEPSVAPFALHVTVLSMEMDHMTSTDAWDKCGCQHLILRVYHLLLDYKWEQSIPQDWEWLLSSAEHFCHLPGAKLQSGRPPDCTTARNIIQMLPVRVRIRHMGHWFRPRPWPSFKYDSYMSHPEESCSDIHSQPRGISGFSSGLVLLWFRDDDCFPVCCCELIPTEELFICLRGAQLPSDATQATVRSVTVSRQQRFLSQDTFKWRGHFTGNCTRFALGGAVLTSFYIGSSKCGSQQLGDLLGHRTCLTIKHTVSLQPWRSDTKVPCFTCFASRSRHLPRSHFHAYQNGSSFQMSWDPGNHIMSNLERHFSCFQGTQLQSRNTPDRTNSGAIKSSREEAIHWEQLHYKNLQFSPYSLEQPQGSDEFFIPYQTTYEFDLEGNKIKSDCSLYFGTHLVGTRLLLIELESHILADSKSMPYACIVCMPQGFTSSHPATPVHEFGYNNKAFSWHSGSSPTGYSFHNHYCRYLCCIVEELNSMRVQNPGKSNGQHASSLIPRALHSCEPWDPGGLDFARMQDFEYRVLLISLLPTHQNCSSPYFQGKNFPEPAENGHRLGGKPIVKEEGMSATQLLPRLRRPKALRWQPKWQAHRLMGRAWLGVDRREGRLLQVTRRGAANSIRAWIRQTARRLFPSPTSCSSSSLVPPPSNPCI